MDALGLARTLGLDGECAEALVEFVSDPTAWIERPGRQAQVALFLRSVADGLLDQAKDAADTEMGAASVLEDEGVRFERRAPTRAQVVNVAAVKAIFPATEEKHAYLYKEQERRGSVSAKLIEREYRKPADTTGQGMPWDD